MKLYRLGDNLCKLIAGKNLFIFNADGKVFRFDSSRRLNISAHWRGARKKCRNFFIWD